MPGLLLRHRCLERIQPFAVALRLTPRAPGLLKSTQSH